jgi:DNA topoisomerase-1
VTNKVVKLLDGRYGPYVTDGTTNASLGKDENPDELTLPRALELLAARAAKGPAKKKPARRSKKAASS